MQYGASSSSFCGNAMKVKISEKEEQVTAINHTPLPLVLFATDFDVLQVSPIKVTSQ